MQVLKKIETFPPGLDSDQNRSVWLTVDDELLFLVFSFTLHLCPIEFSCYIILQEHHPWNVDSRDKVEKNKC